MDTETYISKVLLSLLWGISAFNWVLFLNYLFKKIFNTSNSLLKYLSKSSFSFYIFHYLIITILNYLLLKTRLNHISIWMITTVGTYIILVMVFEVLIKRVKFLRFICGLKNK